MLHHVNNNQQTLFSRRNEKVVFVSKRCNRQFNIFQNKHWGLLNSYVLIRQRTSKEKNTVSAAYSTWKFTMKSETEKIVYVVFKYLSRSLLCKELGGGGVTPYQSPPPYFPADPWIFHLKTTLPLFFSSVFPSRSLPCWSLVKLCSSFLQIFSRNFFKFFKNPNKLTKTFIRIYI